MGGDIYQVRALHIAANNADLQMSSQERKPARMHSAGEKKSLRRAEGFIEL
jgi:hypothetical protein